MEIRTLVLMRHARSGHPGGVRDHDRPLNDDGRSAAALAGDWLSSHLNSVDELLSSTAVRAQQTAVATGLKAPIRTDAGIYDADPDDILEAIRRTDESVGTLLVVGHSPGIPALVGRLLPMPEDGESGQDLGRFPTATMAVLEIAGNWAELAEGGARKVAIRIPPA